MFLADDIVSYPVKSILSLFREIYNAAVQEMADEADSIRTELGTLYQMLETSAIDEATFDARERELLDRLDAIEARDRDDEEQEDEDDLDDEDEDDLDDEDDDDDES
jgi:hypothetical protein